MTREEKRNALEKRLHRADTDAFTFVDDVALIDFGHDYNDAGYCVIRREVSLMGYRQYWYTFTWHYAQTFAGVDKYLANLTETTDETV